MIGQHTTSPDEVKAGGMDRKITRRRRWWRRLGWPLAGVGLVVVLGASSRWPRVPVRCRSSAPTCRSPRSNARRSRTTCPCAPPSRRPPGLLQHQPPAKEIGIRKTLGASTGEMLRLLIGQFLRPVALANLIAWPLAYLAMRAYLAGFDQRIALSPLYFLGATGLTPAGGHRHRRRPDLRRRPGGAGQGATA